MSWLSFGSTVRGGCFGIVRKAITVQTTKEISKHASTGLPFLLSGPPPLPRAPPPRRAGPPWAIPPRPAWGFAALRMAPRTAPNKTQAHARCKQQQQKSAASTAPAPPPRLRLRPLPPFDPSPSPCLALILCRYIRFIPLSCRFLPSWPACHQLPLCQLVLHFATPCA